LHWKEDLLDHRSPVAAAVAAAADNRGIKFSADAFAAQQNSSSGQSHD
jgi:hypothetical protein